MEGLIVLAFIVGALVKFYTWLMGNPADSVVQPGHRKGRSFVSEGVVVYGPFIDDPDRIANRLSVEVFERRRGR
ncbi:hypothetical protein [Azospirillum sp. sgz302134]